MRAAALIPARAGSQRVPGKNVRELGGLPLLAWTIRAALAAGCFERVVVSTDAEEIAAVARAHGAEVPELRPVEMAGSTSPDIDWVRHALALLDPTPELWALLRPTSPFRRPETIAAAVARLAEAGAAADSLRAVQKVRQHPGKMWLREGDLLAPLLPHDGHRVPMHSRQYQDLPEVWAQDSSLEVAWTRTAVALGSIAGERVLAWESDPLEGFSIDYEDDWERAEVLVASGRVRPAESAAR